MIVNSKLKQKSKTILGVIRNVVLDFILCYCIHYMRRYPTPVTWAQGETPVTLCITWGSKLWQTKYMTNNLQQWLHKKMFKIITMKNVATYNLNTHCNLLYALKVWNCLKFIWKRRLIKLLFIKERCLKNVNVSHLRLILKDKVRTTRFTICWF